MLEKIQRFLKTVPTSALEPGFSGLVIRAVDSTESPIQESDLRGTGADAARVAQMIDEHLHADCSYEVETHWDLWVTSPGGRETVQRPEPLVILFNGRDYDEGVAAEEGDIRVDLGFEHLFTGYGGVLGRGAQIAAPEDGTEAEFLAAMAEAGRRSEYREKTCANIRALLEWEASARAALKPERVRMWSEDEGDFEGRLEEILESQ